MLQRSQKGFTEAASERCQTWLHSHPRLHSHCDRFATKKWQSQRCCKGLRKVLLKLPVNVAKPTPQGLQSVAEPNRSRAVFWAYQIGRDWFDRSELLLVSKRSPSGLIFIAHWSPTVLRSRQGWELFATQLRPIGDWSAMRRRSSGASSASGRRLVAEKFPSVRRSFAGGFAIHHRPVYAL